MLIKYQRWYEKNKKMLSAKRKEKYGTNPEYRKKCLERNRKQNQAKVPPVDGYTIDVESAAAQIGVSVWVLRDWRRKGYFPDPVSRSGKHWFTEHQITLLQKLQKSWHQIVFAYGNTLKRQTRREEVCSFISSNWQG